MKKIMVVWTIVMVILVGGLTIICFKIKDENIGTISENALLESAKEYLKDNQDIYPSTGEKIVISNEELKDFGYDSKIINDNCDGYVVIECTEEGFIYTPYVTCENYETLGYGDE